MFSLQLHFIISLPWGVRGKPGEGGYQLRAEVMLRLVLDVDNSGIFGSSCSCYGTRNIPVVIFFFFGAFHLFSFSFSCSGCSLVEYQWFYGHTKQKFTVESYCLEG